MIASKFVLAVLGVLLLASVVFGQYRPLSSQQREEYRRRQETARQKALQAKKRYEQRGPTFFLRPNSFSDLSFQEFAARYTGMGQLGGK